MPEGDEIPEGEMPKKEPPEKPESEMPKGERPENPEGTVMDFLTSASTEIEIKTGGNNFLIIK